MTNHEKLRAEVDKQQAAGFTNDEIRKSLAEQHYSQEEIESSLQRARKSEGNMGFLSVLLSVYFIISGIIKISTREAGSLAHTWGIIMLVVGIGGAIYKINTILKSR
ncbi:MAG: hypothetical protein QM731_23380 [Chitinophagaceae bacterium]